MSATIHVIATTISGSISDWSKVERIVPLFQQRGIHNVELHAVDTHKQARVLAAEILHSGARILISAGGSGTFNAVMEGCIDSQVPLTEVRLGFLRKGSADLIGKVLNMPDEIEAAIDSFVDCISQDRIEPCDLIEVRPDGDKQRIRHFVGYGGAGIFGRVPHYTENRFIKYYKGLLSQLFGDLGPFFVGVSLATLERVIKSLFGGKLHWQINLDGQSVALGQLQAMIIVNGDLGKDLPFASGSKLGSGVFHMFTFEDRGLFAVSRQFKEAWGGKVLKQKQALGFQGYSVKQKLKLTTQEKRPFPLNVDGSTLDCNEYAELRICGQINLYSGS